MLNRRLPSLTPMDACINWANDLRELLARFGHLG